MFVCVCHAVGDKEVRSAIQAGATTREAVTKACRAGGDCGACHQTIEDMIEDHADAGPQLVPACALARDRAA